jgi:hypothetical protein
MTLAELLLLIVGGLAIYFLLRPLQRWLEMRLLRRLARHPRLQRPTIDVTEFTSYSSDTEEEDHEHRS